MIGNKLKKKMYLLKDLQARLQTGQFLMSRWGKRHWYFISECQTRENAKNWRYNIILFRLIIEIL